jgi:hypothetical protein
VVRTGSQGLGPKLYNTRQVTALDIAKADTVQHAAHDIEVPRCVFMIVGARTASASTRANCVLGTGLFR